MHCVKKTPSEMFGTILNTPLILLLFSAGKYKSFLKNIRKISLLSLFTAGFPPKTYEEIAGNAKFEPRNLTATENKKNKKREKFTKSRKFKVAN